MFASSRKGRVLVVVLVAMMPSEPLVAQDSAGVAQRDSAKSDPPRQTPAATPRFEFSGVLFANFQKGGLKANRAQNRFDLERAYLTFRTVAGEHVSIRVTADVFQQRDTVSSSYYRGWAFRAKYAFAQYEYLRASGDEWKANVRLGILNTVVVETEEQVWPRGLSPVAVDQNGFFASSDAGISNTVSFPSRKGELYTTITNGTGYTSRELDRFKDFAVRLTLTPFARDSGYWKGLGISPWFSKGARASDFADRARGTVRRIDDARRRDRYGLLVNVKDPRLAFGAHWARRLDVVESADTLRDVAPSTTNRTGDLVSLYAIVHPLRFIGGAPRWPIAIDLRTDRFEPDVSRAPSQRFYIAGLTWELNQKTSVTFDYQMLQPRNGSTAPDSKTFFMHLIASF